MDITHITSLLGGIALFLYGMSIMGAGLEKLAGGKMQGVLQKLTSSTIKGVIFGTLITGVTMHSVPGWVGDDHCITAEIEGVKAVVDICSSTSAIAGWSAVALLRNLASPVCFY